MLPGDTDDLLVAEEISVEREIIESVFRGSCHEVEVVVVDFSAKLPHGVPFEAGLRIIFRVRALEGKLLGQVLRHKNQASKKKFISHGLIIRHTPSLCPASDDETQNRNSFL